MRGTQNAFICFLLPILLLAAGAIDPARAQQQEKRIALVVGNGAYAKSPLATTANDAGLIAQTLQAAGFDVVGARDLDGDTLRKSFRDFIQKAQASGPGTVAMVYLAGYGIQLAGENYFIPVDSSITRDTDVPTEGLRISDYARQLAAIPLKANIIVLDAARAQPFIEGGQRIASGLALVEPDQNMLIGFNAAPGTVAPEEPGPYGIYAQSLAEMIRTGGLPLPEVFDRVRLRVNEASKGAQVPWNEQKIAAPFSFFERGPDAPPPEAAPDQVAAIRNKPIRDLGVRDAYAAVLERDTLPGYEEFLAAYPGDPLAKRVMAIAAARREAITWRRTYRTDTPEAYWSYLRRYPGGPHADDARRRLAILTAPLEPPPAFAMMDYDVPPPPPAEVIYVDRPVLAFGDPVFDFAPPPPPPVYYLPPPPPDFVVLPPPLPVIGLFVLPQPLFVPIPVYVRAPAYVAPPPNNIVYQNIHNTTVINTVINRPPAPPAAGAGPAPGPGNLAPAVAGRANPAGPAVPQAVAQRAALIQQGKAPMPPSAAIQPVARPGMPAATPANVAPAATPPAAPPAAAPTRLPQANTLPVPGAQGGPPTPPAGAGPGGRLAPTATAPTAPGAPPPGRPGTPTAVAPGTTPPPRSGPPPVAAPATATAPVANPAVTPGPGGKPPGATPPGTPPAVAARPVAPTPPAAGQQIKPPNQALPAQAARPPAAPPPQAVARPTPPPPAAARPAPPPPHVAAPPPARVAPPPVAVRPPPPPVAAVRSPPPPMARPAPPPPVARPAPPPPPRMAVAPPPRPAAPPPKKCPPNQPRC
ncbi:caspase family protein [Bradyrhizobium diazoefficiens]|nr:caspase domain-containing protein [Bradyrhizobium diazoefficiens]MBR0848418.1 caspase family protein [Bradyrhizobium diazoefficiens]